MGRSKAWGLRSRNGIWHINGIAIKGIEGPLYESTGTSDQEEAVAYRDQRIAELRRSALFRERPRRLFREAAAEHLERARKAGNDSVTDDAYHLKMADPFIGDLHLDRVCDETLEPLAKAMRAVGNKTKTIRNRLEVVRRILNASARQWRDPHTGMTWLAEAPKITLPKWSDRRPAYPLSWDEQALLFPLLPGHLASMALYDVNTGLRDGEVCGLRWECWWEMPEVGASGFVLPDTKNDRPRIVVHNRIARSVIDRQRGQHCEWVFPYRGRRIETMNNTGWQRARAELAAEYKKKHGREAPRGLRTLHVHDLRHTFGRWLRAAGVPFETRQDLLGHWNGNVTTEYSAAEVRELNEAVERIAGDGQSTPTLTLIRSAA
jgi:integrase